MHNAAPVLPLAEQPVSVTIQVIHTLVFTGTPAEMGLETPQQYQLEIEEICKQCPQDMLHNAAAITVHRVVQ